VHTPPVRPICVAEGVYVVAQTVSYVVKATASGVWALWWHTTELARRICLAYGS
jgi:hypothetical protein